MSVNFATEDSTRIVDSEYSKSADGIRRPEIASTILGPNASDLYPEPHKKRYFVANPGPLGLCAFALTTFVLSMINVQARHVQIPNVFVGPAFFYGGLVQLLAGILEFFRDNVFGGTAFMSYGAFWMGTGAFYVPSFGILSSYSQNAVDLESALAFYFFAWFIFTTMLLICTVRSTLAFFLLFLFLDLTFLLLAVSKLYPETVAIAKAGGALGIITAFIAWYNALSGLATPQNSFLVFPACEFPWSAEKSNVKRKRTDISS